MSGEPLSEELEAALVRALDGLNARLARYKVIDLTGRAFIPVEVRPILRAFAREIQEPVEAAGKRIADVQNAWLQREVGMLEMTIAEQVAALLASQEREKALAEALETALKAYETRGVLGKRWWTDTREALRAYREAGRGEGKP